MANEPKLWTCPELPAPMKMLHLFVFLAILCIDIDRLISHESGQLCMYMGSGHVSACTTHFCCWSWCECQNVTMCQTKQITQWDPTLCPAVACCHTWSMKQRCCSSQATTAMSINWFSSHAAETLHLHVCHSDCMQMTQRLRACKWGVAFECAFLLLPSFGLEEFITIHSHADKAGTASKSKHLEVRKDRIVSPIPNTPANCSSQKLAFYENMQLNQTDIVDNCMCTHGNQTGVNRQHCSLI